MLVNGGIEMSVLSGVLIEEKDRLNRMISQYERKKQDLPKGSIQYKTIGKKKYPYLVFREKGKVTTVYLKKTIDIEKLSKEISQRKKYEEYIKQAKSDLRLIEKAGIK